jgi:hypothetical protein
MSSTDQDTQFTYDPETPMYCANHPNVETYLRCGKCGKPICAKCRVRTPVGYRCFECANLQVLPTYAVSSDFYLKAGVAGLAVGAVTGVLMGLFPGFEFWAALLVGIAVPEAVATGSNQKRSPGLQGVAVAAVVFAFVVSRVVINAFPGLIPIGWMGVSYSGIGLLDSLPFYLTQYSILWLAMALFLAYRRLA